MDYRPARSHKLRGYPIDADAPAHAIQTDQEFMKRQGKTRFLYFQPQAIVPEMLVCLRQVKETYSLRLRGAVGMFSCHSSGPDTYSP